MDVDGVHGEFVEQFDARDGNARLDGDDRGVARRLHAGERADSADDGFGQAMQPQRDFRDDSERAFRADQQPREIVARGDFFAREPCA